MSNRKATIVVPVHNEAGNIVPLVREVRNVMSSVPGWGIEILFVDDGSTDGTARDIEGLRASGIPVGCITFSRNFGHQAALEAGLFAAEGDVVITMDGDLQHPPAEIPRMLAACEEGVDVVQMVRDRPAAGSKGLFSRLFYRLFAAMAHTEIIPDASDFRLLRRPIVEALKAIPEREKFLRGLIPAMGFRQIALHFRENERHSGCPSYTPGKSLRLASKALFDFSTVPLRFVFWFGLALALTSFVTGAGHVAKKLLSAESITPGFTDIIVSILFLSGCILVALGVLGRYMILILNQVRGRPAYVVKRAVPPAPIPPDPSAAQQ